MAPSATETPATPSHEEIQNTAKAAPVVPTQEETQTTEKSAPAVQPPSKGQATLGHQGSNVPTDEVLPEVLTGHREPLKLSGALDKFESFDVTPIIGREYADVNLAELLRAPNSDELIRDLAITISQRGVVFFRKQDDITNDLQKELVQRLGELSGKPESSKLHIHPVMNSGRAEDRDDEISVISSVQAKKLYSKHFGSRKQSQRAQWHSDITFEPVPSDYSLLRLTQLPKTGGDTLWASGYEVYDRISKPLQGLLESLTATYAQPGFNEAADRNGFKIYSAERGSPENVGEVLEAIHPVIRTNPVTGWKSVFGAGHHVQKINGLSEAESKHFLDWFVQLIVENHDLQVRHRWQNVNDLAIWDNRSVFHAATPDYLFADYGERSGSRAVSLGEKPYYDPGSTSRTDDLKKAFLAEIQS